MMSATAAVESQPVLSRATSISVDKKASEVDEKVLGAESSDDGSSETKVIEKDEEVALEV
jgi:hypothetical protein